MIMEILLPRLPDSLSFEQAVAPQHRGRPEEFLLQRNYINFGNIGSGAAFDLRQVLFQHCQKRIPAGIARASGPGCGKDQLAAR